MWIYHSWATRQLFITRDKATTRQRVKASAMNYHSKKLVTPLTTTSRWRPICKLAFFQGSAYHHCGPRFDSAPAEFGDSTISLFRFVTYMMYHSTVYIYHTILLLADQKATLHAISDIALELFFKHLSPTYVYRCPCLPLCNKQKVKTKTQDYYMVVSQLRALQVQ